MSERKLDNVISAKMYPEAHCEIPVSESVMTGTTETSPMIMNSHNGHSFIELGLLTQQLSSAKTSSRRFYNQQEFDESFGLRRDEDGPSMKEKLVKYMQRKCSCNRSCLLQSFTDRLPIVKVFRSYKWKEWIVADICSGVSVAVTDIPQGIAYSILASVPPVYGLYTSLFPVLFYSFFGTSLNISISTMALIALMVGVVVNREVVLLYPSGSGPLPYNNGSGSVFDQLSLVESFSRHTHESSNNVTEVPFLDDNSLSLIPGGMDLAKVEIASSIALLVGLFQLAMGLLRCGGLLDKFIPLPFVNGFMTAAGLHIVISQVPLILGIQLKPITGTFHFPKKIIGIITNIGSTNPAEATIGLLCMAVLFVTKEIVNERFRRKLIVPIPAEFIIVIITTMLSYFVDFRQRFDVKIIGHVPRGIEAPEMPTLRNASNYALDSLVIALVSIVISLSMAKIFASKYKYSIDVDQEVTAFGLSNGLGSFFHCFAGASAPPRNFVQESSGGRTQLANLVSASIILVVCLSLGPLFEPLPKCALGAIIICALLRLFKQVRDLRSWWFVSRWDLLTWVVTFASVAITDIITGLVIGIGFNVFAVVLRLQAARGHLLGDSIGEPRELYPSTKHYAKAAPSKLGVKVFQFGASLFYGNAESFKRQLFNKTLNPMNSEMKPSETKVVGHKERENEEENGEFGTNKRLHVSTNGKHLFDNSRCTDKTEEGIAASVEQSKNEGEVKNDDYLKSKGISSPSAVIIESANGAIKVSESATDKHKIESEAKATESAIAIAALPLSVIILDCSTMSYIDIVGLNTLKQLVADYTAVGVNLVLAQCTPQVLAQLRHLDKLGAQFVVYPTVCDALHLETRPILVEKTEGWG